MKVIIDYDRCQSNANCLDECPEVFQLDDEARPVVVCLQPTEALRDKVGFAARCCPRSAITILRREQPDASVRAPTTASQ